MFECTSRNSRSHSFKKVKTYHEIIGIYFYYLFKLKLNHGTSSGKLKTAAGKDKGMVRYFLLMSYPF